MDANQKQIPDDFRILFPERINHHKKCRPPEQAYFFFPKGNDIVEWDDMNPKSISRKIFEGKDNLLPLERSKLIEFKTKVEEEKINIPDTWKEPDTLRFLQATGYERKKAIELIKQHVNWKRQNFPLKVKETTVEILDSGVFYVHGRDNHFRPIIVVNVELYLKLCKKYYHEDFVLAIVYFVEYILHFMLIPGQIESWIIICDLKNVSLLKPPTELISIFKILQSNYRCRLARVYIRGMSAVLNFLFSILKPFIEKNTQKKIRFIKPDASGTIELFEFINPTQLELKFGGLAPNVEHEFFPGTIPSEKFLKDDDDPEEILVSEQKYIDYVIFEGRVVKVSPFLENKINSIMVTFNNESVYEDAKSSLHKANKKQSLNGSIYENCKGDFDELIVIDHENSDLTKKKINNLTDAVSPSKNYMSVPYEEKIISNYNTNLFDGTDLMQSVKTNHVSSSRHKDEETLRKNEDVMFEMGERHSQCCSGKKNSCSIF